MTRHHRGTAFLLATITLSVTAMLGCETAAPQVSSSVPRIESPTDSVGAVAQVKLPAVTREPDPTPAPAEEIAAAAPVAKNETKSETTPAAGIETSADGAFTIAPIPQAKGSLGKISVTFPEVRGKECQSFVEICRGEKASGGKQASSWYGSGFAELLPGSYDVYILDAHVGPVEVRKRSETRISVGLLAIEAESKTHITILDPARNEVTSFYGDHLVGLPVGKYLVALAGAEQEVAIEKDQVTEP